MMKAIFAIVLAVCLAGADARVLAQDTPSYPSVAAALTAPENNATLSTLLAAVQAANITIPENVTIFAPTNAAFASSSIKDKTGLSAADLLLPANKDILVKVLTYHVVPSAAVLSTQLTNGQVIPTALANATVTVTIADGKVKINDANVVTADIKAGGSVIHVIDAVLLPADLVKA